MERPKGTRPTAGLLAVAAGGCLLLAAAVPCRADGVVSASQVCATDADPCKVTTTIQVADGAVLDFGVRAVQMSGSGQFNFGAGSGSVLCGPFSAATTGAAINAKGTGPEGGIESGSVLVASRRLCDAGATALPCVTDEECQLGSCSVRRCSGRPTRTCTSDASCSVGPCGANKRCAGAAGIVRCSTNADCEYGTCPEQLTCANKSTTPVACTVDGDCDFGACSVGTASISMGGAVTGNSALPAVVTLRAADSVSILKTINVSSTDTEEDGGEIAIEAAAGSVTVTAKVAATGGSAAQGGSVDVLAGVDVTLAEEITVTGGDFDGGSVLVRAGRDAVLARNILASSGFGAGFGGEILASAGRDLAVSGASPSNPAALEASGHTATNGGAGDGGTVDLSASRNASLTANSRLAGRGAGPDGAGAQIFVSAGGTVTVAGKVDAGTDGASGGGGSIELDSVGATSVAAGATLIAAGGSKGGGRVVATSGGVLDYAGNADVGAAAPGAGGSATFVSGGDANWSGRIAASGGGGGLLTIEACRIALSAGGLLANAAVGGENRLVAHESMKLLAGSTLSATSGKNVLVYRTPAKPPVLLGTVAPSAQKIVDGTLTGCPVCGNAEVDAGETCDDGNTTGGDGCSADCQNENCIAQTVAPGYPAVALCEDGKPCTDDFCNTSQNGGTCRHRAKDCSDDVACTTDACVSGACVHTAVDSACSDGNVCTDDFCSPVSGCSAVANNGTCDDGNVCTRDDRCTGTSCAGVLSEVCGDCGDGSVDSPEECDDGNSTFVNGEDCGVGCVKIPCGKPTNSSGATPKAGDALWALKAAVSLASCSLKVCDVDDNGKVSASDALRILRAAVGLPGTLRCPL